MCKSQKSITPDREETASQNSQCPAMLFGRLVSFATRRIVHGKNAADMTSLNDLFTLPRIIIGMLQILQK